MGNEAISLIFFLAFVALAIWMLTGKSRQRRQMMKSAPTRDDRTQTLLRMCTGLEEDAFRQADTQARHTAILQYMNDPDSPLILKTEFPRWTSSIGMYESEIETYWIEAFEIRRTVGSMQSFSRFLQAAALLYNADLIDIQFFDNVAMSAYFQDGQAQIFAHKRFCGPPNKGIDSADNALRYIMDRHYKSASSTADWLKTELRTLHGKIKDLPQADFKRQAFTAAERTIT